MSDQQSLRTLLLARSVRHGDFVLASGLRSSYYIDARPSTMSAEGQALIGRLGLAVIRARGWEPTAVGGLTMGADPVACALAGASVAQPPTVDAFSVRKEPKDHGTGRQIEGNFAPGASVVVVEDVLTSGGSALRAVEAVRRARGVVLGVLVVVDREQGGAKRLADAGIDVVSLTTTTELGLGGHPVEA